MHDPFLQKVLQLALFEPRAFAIGAPPRATLLFVPPTSPLDPGYFCPCELSRPFLLSLPPADGQLKALQKLPLNVDEMHRGLGTPLGSLWHQLTHGAAVVISPLANICKQCIGLCDVDFRKEGNAPPGLLLIRRQPQPPRAAVDA